MWKIYSLLIAVQFLFIHSVCAQGSPAWEHPLLTCTSTDGINFNQPVLFQDSSGVPCAIRWKGDTLICTFQWFREPMGSPTWDRVAVKFSYDDGSTWTNPVPIVINNFPSSYQRPFDPTLVRFANDSLRIYYSSRDGLSGVPDSLINTYSAFSTDGIHYEFEPGARADHPSQRLIDPAVAFFNHSWHYISPKGAPQDGAYHFISPGGIQFSQVQDIPSDSMHNWTGNYLVMDSTELRFYGCGGARIWYNSTPNGGVWNGYISTNIQGGDPTVFRKRNGNHQLIFTGATLPTSMDEIHSLSNSIEIFPNPIENEFTIRILDPNEDILHFTLTDISGKILHEGTLEEKKIIETNSLASGIYFLLLNTSKSKAEKKLIVSGS